MDYKRLQKNVQDICNQNNLILSDELNEDSYIATIMDSDQEKNNALNISAGENGIETSVVTSNGDEVEKFSKDGEFNDDEGLEFVMDSIDSFQILSGIDPKETDDEGNPILNEDEDVTDEFSGIVDGLNKIKLDQKRIADKLRDLSKLSDDPEVIAIIMDLSNNSYSAILDMEAAIDSYNEIMEIPEEDESEDEEITEESKKRVCEAKNRVDVARSVMAVKELNKSGVISDEDCKAYEDVCRRMFD